MLLESNHYKMSEIGSIRAFDPKSDGIDHTVMVEIREKGTTNPIEWYSNFERQVLDSKIGEGNETLRNWLYKDGKDDPGYFARTLVDCVIFVDGEGHSAIPSADTLTENWLKAVAIDYNALLFIFYANSVPEDKRISGTITFE